MAQMRGLNEEEAKYLVYEFFCATKKCPHPVPEFMPGDKTGFMPKHPPGTGLTLEEAQKWRTSKKEILPEVRTLLTETASWHSSRSKVKIALDMCIAEIWKSETNKTDSEIANSKDVVATIDKIARCWDEYCNDNSIDIAFWRPDSWTRYADADPNHTLTNILKNIQ